MGKLANSWANDAPKVIQLENTAKRDVLIGYQKHYQEYWRSLKCFEKDPPSHPEDGSDPNVRYPKFFATMAYPYMNGILHLGHAFTLTKVEFATGYERLKRRVALFPLGFHCSGMPIQANADKLAREVEQFGNDFSKFETPEEISEKNEAKDSEYNPEKFQGTKGKLALKSAGLKYQFQIMESTGVPRDQISQFVDPLKWLEYFPGKCREDCDLFGARIDWRRSMITTDANPYYDSFVRWMMNKLKKQDRIRFGKRYTIFSPKDDQPCMDHDRRDGEGLGPQEYTAIKMEVVQFGSKEAQDVQSKAGNAKLYLVAATLRPETMYAQTNCFVGPNITYGVYKSNNPDELYICTRRAIRNMAYQNLSPSRGVIKEVASIKGQQLIGTLVKAPNSVLKEVWVLPMGSVLETKGTGVVTSVPSDSPDDYATYMDLRKKADYYKLDPSWMKADPIPIIHTPNYGEMCAQHLVEEMKINGPRDSAKLAKAKELAYKEGFYQGALLLGSYKGEKVEIAKPLIQKEMIANNLAFIYNEPEGKIISRSGDECCVALCDQWYLNYGEESWKRDAFENLDMMNTFGPEARNGFVGTLNWLNQWACSRSYGLGTSLPWDRQYLVESLSDSTVYMAYFTVAHHLHSKIDGSVIGDFKISPEEMTDEIWEYIFCGGDIPQSTIDESKLKQLRYEFDFFYPLDCNISGKDLIPNHMTFSIYCHTALFPKKYWPRGARANGHLLLNGEKMSKSTGNFMTMRDACEKFGSDAVRIALADAGDGLEDANFEESTANAAVLRLFILDQWCTEQMENLESLRQGEKTFHDLAFENEVNNLILMADKAFEKAFYREALLYSYFEMQKSRDWYRELTLDQKMHKDVILFWIKTQTILLSVFAPHWAEHCWKETLKETDSVQNTRYPQISAPIERKYSSALSYIRGLARDIHIAEATQIKKMKKRKTQVFDPKKPKQLDIYVGTKFPEWQQEYVQVIQKNYDEKKNEINEANVMNFAKDQREPEKGIRFVQLFKKALTLRDDGREASHVFERKLDFDEVEAIEASLGYLQRSAGIQKINVYLIREKGNSVVGYNLDEDRAEINHLFAESAVPGSPTFYLYNPPQSE